MKAALVLLLLAAGLCAAQAAAADAAGTYGRRLQQTPNTCPIANCRDASSCVFDSARRSWTCRVCRAPFVPNTARTACVCPAGQYPVAGGRCALCKLGFYCPQGTSPTRSTATRCPANMVTVRRGAANIFDCLNAPGFRYLRTVSSVRAVACGDNEYSVGLAKQTACNKCPPGFETDPDNAPGDHTSSAVCVAPPGKFMTGESTSPCPVGEFSDSYSNATSCTTCEEALGSPGVTTGATGSTSKAACNWPMQGYILLDDKKKVITTAFDSAANPPVHIISGAKLCPQSWYCQGGDPNVAAASGGGVPTPCFAAGTEGNLNRLWTDTEGAFASSQCVAPPGHYINAGVVTKCNAGDYRVGFSNATACEPCGAGLWLADENIFINQLDAYGAVRRSWSTRGSPDSCFIQAGMGAIRNGTIGGVLAAILCPANTYGVVDRKYGRVVTPCTPCPTNLVTGFATDASVRAQNYLAVSGISTASTPTTSGTAYFNVAACFTQAGYGYFNGASQQCPKGWYNAANNRDACKQCPYGTTTNTIAASQASVNDCDFYLAGFGLINGVTGLCPVGTFHREDAALFDGSNAAAAACDACPSDHWTPAPGAVDGGVTPALPHSLPGDIVCNLCRPGYYSSDAGVTCAICEDGYFCPSSRTGNDVSRVACPTGRTYTYTWETTEVYEPPATSVAGATTPDDCVALFAQTTDQSSFLNLAYGGPNEALAPVVPDVLGLITCIEVCDANAACMGVTFSYNGTEPECRTLLSGASTAGSGYAFKTMPSTNLAQSKKVAKGMGTGYFTIWEDVANAAVDAIASAVASTTSLLACQEACTLDPLCAGIKYVDYTAPDTITGCSKIVSSAAINTNRRTLIRAVFGQINAL